MKFPILVILVLVAIGAQPGSAENLRTAGDIQRQCSKPGQEQECTAYALGFAEGMLAANKGAVAICVPESVTSRELRLVMDKYFKDHPEKLHDKASAVIGAAFAGAYPCKN